MVLGKLPVPGRPTIWVTVGQGPTALAVVAGGGCLDIFILIYPFSPLSLSLGDGPILTEILPQRAVKPKTTNQPSWWSCFSPFLRNRCSAEAIRARVACQDIPITLFFQTLGLSDIEIVSP